MDHAWNKGASLAPNTNEMQTGTPEEFLRRYPGAEELPQLLLAVQDAVEAYKVWRTHPGYQEEERFTPYMDALRDALDALMGVPARRSNAR